MKESSVPVLACCAACTHGEAGWKVLSQILLWPIEAAVISWSSQPDKPVKLGSWSPAGKKTTNLHYHIAAIFSQYTRENGAICPFGVFLPKLYYFFASKLAISP